LIECITFPISPISPLNPASTFSVEHTCSMKFYDRWLISWVKSTTLLACVMDVNTASVIKVSSCNAKSLPGISSSSANFAHTGGICTVRSSMCFYTMDWPTVNDFWLFSISDGFVIDLIRAIISAIAVSVSMTIFSLSWMDWIPHSMANSNIFNDYSSLRSSILTLTMIWLMSLSTLCSTILVSPYAASSSLSPSWSISDRDFWRYSVQFYYKSSTKKSMTV
jgi:hypothetical protein